MNAGPSGLDRLLPRHEIPPTVEVEWDVRERRRGIRKTTEACVIGRLRDLSLEGALIEVPSPSEFEPDDSVKIRIRGEEGRAVIRHVRPGSNGDRVLYGVRFEMTPGLLEVVNQEVELRRGVSPGDLKTAWERSR